MHTITLNEIEWITVLTIINANDENISNYYIFKRIRSIKNYLALCEHKATFDMQKRAW